MHPVSSGYGHKGEEENSRIVSIGDRKTKSVTNEKVLRPYKPTKKVFGNNQKKNYKEVVESLRPEETRYIEEECEKLEASKWFPAIIKIYLKFWGAK